MNREEYLNLFEKVKPHQKPDELYFLVEFLKDFDVKTMVEIGTGCGGTAAVLTKEFPNAKVKSLDITHLEEAQKNADEYKFEYIISDSNNIDILPKEKIDFLFIDGSHTYEDVKRDFELWSPYAKIIGFHDIVWNCGKPGMSTATVWKFWNELREEYKPDNVKEIICSAYGGAVEHSGIGVIWKTE